MPIKSNSNKNIKELEKNGQLQLFGNDNLIFKTVNLPYKQRLLGLCYRFKLKKIIIKKKLLINYFKI